MKSEAGLPAPLVPQRFVAYLFDDIHLQFGDLVRVRDAAREHIKGSLAEGDRAAIYTTSGQTNLEFTDDVDKLSDMLLLMRTRPTLDPQRVGMPGPEPLPGEPHR